MKADPIAMMYLAAGLQENPATVKQLVQWMLTTSEEDETPLTTDEISRVLLITLNAGVKAYETQGQEPVIREVLDLKICAPCEQEPEPEPETEDEGWVEMPGFSQSASTVKGHWESSIPSITKSGFKLLNHGFVPSKYQHDIFEWIATGTGNGMAIGVAGCGKTTVIKEGIKYLPKSKRILLLAFNKHIEVALKREIKEPHVDIATFNAYGWRACRNNWKGIRLERHKDRQILMGFVNPKTDGASYNRLKGPIIRTIGLLKALNYQSINGWQKIVSDYGIELDSLKPSDKFENVLETVFEISKNDIETMSFDDQLYQPVRNNWAFQKYDFILVDESQDCSPINMEIINRSIAPGGRVLLVGDPDQAIYMFRGAHPDAMQEMARNLDAVSLPLSVCYRCPDAVIESAQEEVPRIEAPQPNPRGKGIVETIQTVEFEKNVRVGDLVVCRMTHPLIKRCLIQWGKGKKALVKGRDLAEQLIELIEKVHGRPDLLKQQHNQLSYDIHQYHSMREIDPSMGKLPTPSGLADAADFLDDLSRHIGSEKANLMARGLEEQAEQLEDREMGIISLAEGCTHTIQIIIKIEEMFAEDADDSAIMFMTGHKAKGLEYDREFILRPDLCPSKRAKTPAQQKQEKNLMYVMKTRAMKELYFVQKERDEK